jgi:methionyl-tRNA formyltransferase
MSGNKRDSKSLDEMRVGWLSFHEESVLALEGVLKQGVSIVALITINEDQRAKRSAAFDFSHLSQAWHIPLYEISNINDEKSLELLHNLELDMLIVLGWSQILKQEALNAIKRYVIGSHASLLPLNRGSAPINWAMINGDLTTGNTLMVLNNTVDMGDIICQEKFEISKWDTCATLYGKVAVSNSSMLLDFFNSLREDKLSLVSQSATRGTLLRRRKPEDGLIDWDQEPLRIYNHIRGLTKPYPGAFSFRGGDKFYFWECGYLDSQVFSGFSDTPDVRNGTVIEHLISPASSALVIKCTQGIVLVFELEDDNKITYKNQDLIESFSLGTLFEEKI